MSSGRTVKLYTGQEIPAVGLGTWVSQINAGLVLWRVPGFDVVG
jgi:hypothetical protein